MTLKSPMSGPLGRSDADELGRAMKILANPSRLMILSQLSRGESFGEQLARRIGLSQPTTAHHLNLLASAGLIAGRRDGRLVMYRIQPTAFVHLAGLLRPRAGQ
jgi:DNA-binding transcriptional ArsR family regulator